MLQGRKNEISMRKCSGGSTHLRTLKGTLVTMESARFDNNVPKRIYKSFKDTYCQKHSVIF